MSMRDRNKIALQSDLLGANEVDIRAILALTGDPATISDQPHAKGVFEADSSMLLDIISCSNSGIDYAGKPLLLHFWATWCPTCKLEAANIQSLSQEYSVLTIAVKSGSDEKINRYLKEHDLDFKVINDSQGLLSQQFSVPAFPTTFIYDKEGKLRFTEVGYTSTWGLYRRMWWAGR